MATPIHNFLHHPIGSSRSGTPTCCYWMVTWLLGQNTLGHLMAGVGLDQPSLSYRYISFSFLIYALGRPAVPPF